MAGALLLLALALAILRLDGVQRSLFRRAAAAVESRTGLRVEAQAARLRPLAGSLLLTRPSVAVGSAEPFLTAEALKVRLSPLSLIRGPVVLREVLLLAPRLDGSRPLPEPPHTAGAGGPPAVAVEMLQIQDGQAAGFALPAALAPHLGSASLAGLWLEGELVDGRLRLQWEGARVRLEPDWRPALELVVEGRLAGPPDGPLRLERLEVDSDALEASGTAWLGVDPEQPVTIAFELHGDATRLLAADAEPGAVRLSGDLDLRAMRGELRLEAAGLPAELARPWTGEALFEQAALAGSRLRLEGAIELDGEDLGGSVTARWLRGEEVVAALDGAAAAALSASEVPVDLRLDLLPALAGSRSLEARLLLPRDDAAQGRIESGLLKLLLPDLEAELAALRERWPDWVPAPPAGLAAGPLELDARFSGELGDPMVRLRGRWTPAPGASVRITGGGRPVAGMLDGRVAVERLPLSRFVDGAAGLLAGDATLRARGGALSGELLLDGEGLGRGEPAVERLRLEAALDGRRVALRRLAAWQGGRELQATGEIDLRGTPAADLEFGLSGGWGPMSEAGGTLRLQEGRLLLDLPRVELAGVTASLSAAAPLGTLAELPGAEALGELPFRGAGGPLEVAWDLPALDWARALGVGPPTGEAEGQPSSRWVVGSGGRLELEPSSPETATGEMEISIPGFEHAGASLRAARPLALTLAAGRLSLEPAEIEVDGRRVELAGEARLRPGWSPPQDPRELLEEVQLTVHAPATSPVDALDASLLLRDGGLELTAEALMAGGEVGRLVATAPLAALTGASRGELDLSWELPAADWSGWLEDGGEEESVTRLTVGTEGRLRLDLERPALAAGELRVRQLDVELGGQSLRSREPIALRLADGRLNVEAARLTASDAPLEITGWVDLEPGWRPGSPITELLREVDLDGGGVLPAALLNPFLEGGAGEGTMLVELDIGGVGRAARGEVRIRGPGARVYFVSPYALEVAAPQLTLQLTGGAASFEGAARLNEGTLSFSGEADPERGAAVRARLDKVRAVLDYGLLTLLDGELRLDLAPDGRGLLAGTVTVDGGQLTRPMRLESLLLEQLLPADLLGTELDPLEAIDLDLRLTTRQGVRVRNNLADLKVRWEPISVRGNLLQPIIEGRLEVDPGGLVYAYGQTVRVDSAAVTYRGLPAETPILELQTTTSIEDPSIGRLSGDHAFAERRPAAAAAREGDPRAGDVAGEALTLGVATFLGEQIGGSAVGGGRISFRPVVIFGEADPGARLTAASELSAHAVLAASIDLRNAERQTYLLDLHDEQAAARLSAQLFTNDLGNEGGTLQQRLHFGSGHRRVEGPRLRRLEIDRVPAIRQRALKRAVGYRKGERLAEGAAFEIGVAVGELMRDRGYPDARVRVEEGPPPRRPGVALKVRIDSGPHVEFRFTGDELPKALRRAVSQLYRGDFYEPTALEEMRAEAVRADLLSRAAIEVESELRGAGYLDAEVTLRIDPLGEDRPNERKAVFEIDRGRLYRLAATEFEGLGATRPSWARRTAGLLPGETLAPGELHDARRRLYGTGLFSAVGSDVEAGEQGARVLFQVQEEPRFRLAYGVRWESEEGSSLVVDLLDRNFLGRGVDLGVRTLWSEEARELRLSGSVPGVLGPKSSLDLFARVSEEERLVDDGEALDETRTVEGTIQLGWQLGRRTTGRVYGRYLDRRFTETFLEEDPFFGPLDPIEARVRQPFLGLQYIFDGRDDRVVPRRGLFASIDLSYSDESLGGDIRYGRVFGQLHGFRPAGRLAGRRLTWAQSVRLGRAEAFAGQELLGDLLLRAGGEHSVRGYRRESLGPPELLRPPLPSIRENSLLVFNQELRFELWDLLSGLVFFDAGNVWIDEDLDLDLFTSLGFGLRADTPFGLLRLDLAWPLDARPEIDADVKLYFGLGHVF